MIDIGNVVKAEATFDVELTHPGTGARVGVTISVHGMDSVSYKDAAHAQRLKRFKGGRGRQALNITPAELEQDAIELLAACTTGWKTGDKPTMTFNGEELTFTPGNAIKVYRAVPWVREQVDAAIADRANFTNNG